jgi:hypothetical protein
MLGKRSDDLKRIVVKKLDKLKYFGNIGKRDDESDYSTSQEYYYY